MKIYSVNYSSKTAGPSIPQFNDERVEIFFAGCNIAMEGHPCKGCFNANLWNRDSGLEITPKQLVDDIMLSTNNRYVTIVGGEPVDQSDDLISLCELLKQYNFHIVLISHYSQEEIMYKCGNQLFENIDILIDGEYQQDKRIFDSDNRAGIYHVIGSSNQNIYYIQHAYYHKEDRQFISIVLVTLPHDVTEEQLRFYYQHSSYRTIICNGDHT